MFAMLCAFVYHDTIESLVSLNISLVTRYSLPLAVHRVCYRCTLLSRIGITLTTFHRAKSHQYTSRTPSTPTCLLVPLSSTMHLCYQSSVTRYAVVQRCR